LDKQTTHLLHLLTARLAPHIPAAERATFFARLQQHFPTILRLIYQLYGARYDFFYHLEQILTIVAQSYAARSGELKALDRQREADPQWYQSEKMMGAVCYVDLFAQNLDGIRQHIPYFQELGVTYLHLMPLFRAPEPNSDGGYAISSFREVQASLGSMDGLAALAAELRAHGICLVLDFVFNHTSDEHAWAKAALAGDEHHQDFYLMFEDRQLPDMYERHLREIFPDQAPGNFTYRPEIGRWVWTTFHRFQWDLNYANPDVFAAMLGELLFLANVGTQILRLDAVAFIWKQLGTTCENLPQVHMIIQAFNALVQVAAPALLFKSEAIVHPSAVATYVQPHEAQLSYNPTLMALLWEALATRDVRLLSITMQRYFKLPQGTAWINYVRVHDDIGWTFADEVAAEIGINGFDHRQFLNRFYTGTFEGSFAKGVPFNFNPATLDMRISGTCASLAGLETAQVAAQTPTYRDHARKRILLIHSVILSVGGIPLLYLGDEIGMLNDYSYEQVEGKAEDSRWVHRPLFDWARAAQRHDRDTDAGWLFQHLKQLIELRRANTAFANGETNFFGTGNRQVLAYMCNRQVLVLANFSEQAQTLAAPWAGRDLIDLVTGQAYHGDGRLTLQPYQFVWLKVKQA
jgi:amylosucrase